MRPVAIPLAIPPAVTQAPRIRRIGIVGGVDRTVVLLARAAATIGCKIEHHHGRMTHVASSDLAALIDRVDLVLILTDVNSHTAVSSARRIATAAGRPYVLLRRLSPGRLAGLVTDLERQRGAAAA